MKRLILTSLTILAISSYCSAQKLVQSYKVTYDEYLNPVISLTLKNKLPKQVSHIVYQFSFFDSTGWQDTSVSRSLEASSSTNATRLVNLKSGASATDSFRIPQLSQGAREEPKGIKIIMVRYADGTVDKSITR